MTAFRWFLGLCLAVISLVAAAKAVAIYVDHGLWLGVVAVAVLGVMDVGGFGSLAWARWRLSRELRALDCDTPGGELYASRQQRLAAMAMRDVPPDVHALADATHAEETGRAYLGRYMVAVTVLVGLVGTFAGLMETLHRVAPMVADDKATALSMALPLAGLDVTFGASIVGILVTLALSLVQGDLVIAEDLVLARLHERTVHVLIPSLWPPAGQPSQRMAHDLNALRREIAACVVDMAEASAQRVSRVAAAEVERLARELRDTMAAAVRDSSAQMRQATADVVATLDHKLQPVLAEQARLAAQTREALSQVGQQVARAVAAAAEAAVQGIAESSHAAVQGIAAAEASSRRALSEASERGVAAQQQALAAVDGVAARTEVALRAMTQAHVERIGAATNEVARAITGATQSAVGGIAGADAATRQALERTAHEAAALHAQLLHDTRQQSAQLQASFHGVAERTAGSLEHLTRTHAQELKAAAAAVVASSQAAVDRLHHSGTHAAEGFERVLGRSTEVHDKLLAAVSNGLAQVAARLDGLAAGVQAALESTAHNAQAALLSSQQAHAAALDDTAAALRHSVQHTLADAGAQLRAAAQSLSAAVAELTRGASALAPSVATLAPELGALSREVALLAARGDAEEDRGAVIDEIARLGEGVNRLEDLLRLAQGGQG